MRCPAASTNVLDLANRRGAFFTKDGACLGTAAPCSLSPTDAAYIAGLVDGEGRSL